MDLIEFIKEDLININIKSTIKETFFESIHESLYKEGYVTSQFKEKILQREIDFPTAINIGNYGIAIPHTDAEYVLKEFIYIYIFKQPLTLKSMKNGKDNVPVHIAFILGLNKSHNRLKVLKELMELSRNKELIRTLINANNSKEVINIIRKYVEE